MFVTHMSLHMCLVNDMSRNLCAMLSAAQREQQVVVCVRVPGKQSCDAEERGSDEKRADHGLKRGCVGIHYLLDRALN